MHGISYKTICFFSVNEDCIGSRVCSGNKCVDPCAYACGVGALCHTKNHVPVCSCPLGHTGNPSLKCIYDPGKICNSLMY